MHCGDPELEFRSILLIERSVLQVLLISYINDHSIVPCFPFDYFEFTPDIPAEGC